MSQLYPGAALIATGLSLHGYRKGSLSASGAIAAWLVGYGHLANPLKVFGVTMIVFYLAGSRATKVKADVKAKLEDGPDPLKPGGNRDALQVLSSSLPSLVAALAYRLHSVSTAGGSTPLALNISARPLIYLALGHFSTCLADTLASELGILSRSPPIFILSGKTVPPGTNGGVSLLGLGASVAGGAIMGLTMVIDLLLENPASRVDASRWIGEMMTFGILAGLGGSLVSYSVDVPGALSGKANTLQLDSLLGALFQKTLYSTTDKRILTDNSASRRAEDRPDIVQIGPGVDLLSNTAVNFVCGCLMGWVGYAWGSR